MFSAYWKLFFLEAICGVSGEGKGRGDNWARKSMLCVLGWLAETSNSCAIIYSEGTLPSHWLVCAKRINTRTHNSSDNCSTVNWAIRTGCFNPTRLQINLAPGNDLHLDLCYLGRRFSAAHNITSPRSDHVPTVCPDSHVQLWRAWGRVEITEQ